MKLYKRDGRRFVEVQDVTGMFFQKDGSFARTRNKDTIGICVLQTASIRKVVLFEKAHGNWDRCNAICCLKGGHMPSRAEMYLFLDFIRRFGLPPNDYYWTKEEFNSGSTWILNLYNGRDFGKVSHIYKQNNCSVLIFKDIQI